MSCYYLLFSRNDVRTVFTTLHKQLKSHLPSTLVWCDPRPLTHRVPPNFLCQVFHARVCGTPHERRSVHNPAREKCRLPHTKQSKLRPRVPPQPSMPSDCSGFRPTTNAQTSRTQCTPKGLSLALVHALSTRSPPQPPLSSRRPPLPQPHYTMT